MEEKKVTVIPRIGEPAPEFTAQTTQGKINFPSDYKGKWAILFSHPADFTPVCTTEFMTFASMMQEFKDLNTELIGLSVDGLFSHVSWLRKIKEIDYKGMKGLDITFPLIDDLTMEVANLYGMIQPGESSTSAVRAVFVVDPKGMIRTILYYPMALGRNFDEIKRIIIGLQTADNFGVALPANWRPGDEAIVPPTATMDAAEKSMKDDKLKCYDWFFCTKEISKEEIEKKLGKK